MAVWAAKWEGVLVITALMTRTQQTAYRMLVLLEGDEKSTGQDGVLK